MVSNMEGLIHHIEIYVSNLKKSSDFWKYLLESFGYIKFQQWSKGISWKKANTYIVFVQTNEKYLDTPYNRCRTGLNHIAFQVSSKVKLDLMADSLKSKGIIILYEDKFRKIDGANPYSIFFEDPDRIKVELVLSDLVE